MKLSSENIHFFACCWKKKHQIEDDERDKALELRPSSPRPKWTKVADSHQIRKFEKNELEYLLWLLNSHVWTWNDVGIASNMCFACFLDDSTSNQSTGKCLPCPDPSSFLSLTIFFCRPDDSSLNWRDSRRLRVARCHNSAGQGTQWNSRFKGKCPISSGINQLDERFEEGADAFYSRELSR